MSTTKASDNIRKHFGRLVVSAMFLALAVVINTFTEIAIPLFGADGMQVKFGGVFTAFPAFLFGPFYGGIVCAASDILGAFIKPTGAYVPWFTVTAFIAGFLKGLVFMLIKDRNVKWLKAVLAVMIALAAFIGIFSFVSMKNDKIYDGAFATSENVLSAQELLDNRESYSVPSKLAIKYAFSNAQRQSLPKIPTLPAEPDFLANQNFLLKTELETVEEYSTRLSGMSEKLNQYILDKTTYEDDVEKYAEKIAKYETLDDNGKEIYILKSKFAPALASTVNIIAPTMITFAVLGAILLCFMIIVEKKYQLGSFAPKIFLSVLVAELVQTSINSVLLINLYTTTYQNFSYVLFNTPRVLEGILMSIILSYFIYVLYQVYDSKIKGKLRII